MLRRPDLEDVLQHGKALGLGLNAVEANVMHARMAATFAALDAFNELRLEEDKPPLKYSDRDIGYQPDRSEDPLNAFIRKCRILGASSGPLQGKTIGLKDNIAVAGVPLTFGSHSMDHYIPDFDATVVTRLLDAGATIVGKTKMEEFSFGGPGLSGVGDYGRPLNPHDHRHVTGGSSSGSAVAVASSAVDIAFGGDQGGSIRLPAAWCGAIGLKATHGLVPHTGVFGLDPLIDFVGPLARTTADIATALECVAGPDGFDPRQCALPAQLPSYTQALSRGVEGLRIGLLTEGLEIDGMEPDVRDAVLEAATRFEKLGAAASRVSVPLHDTAGSTLLPIFLEGGKRLFDTNFGGAFAQTYYPTSLISTIGRLRASHGYELPWNVKLNLVTASYVEQLYHGTLYAKAVNARPAFVRAYDLAFQSVDLLAMPTIPIKAPEWREPRTFEETVDHTIFGGATGMDLGLVVRNTWPFNYSGHPAISLPCAKSGGLPIGLMLVAPRFREDLLIQAAAAHERSVDWAKLIAVA